MAMTFLQESTRAMRSQLLRNREALAERTRPGEDGHESGAVLVLALILLVAISLIIGGILAWTGNDLVNAANLRNSRNADFALNGATQLAIQNIRYTPLLGAGQTLNANPPSNCWAPSSPGTPSQDALDGYTVDVYCSTVWHPTQAVTRVVTISACLDPSTGQSCAAGPGLQTIVTFDDYSSNNPSINPGVCTSTCGAGMTINSSSIMSNLPTVTGISTTTGPVNTGATLTVSGTGFVANATTVSFVSTSPSQNQVLAGIGPNVSSSTSLTVTAPPATTATSFYVEVTTPNGTSPVVPPQSPQFTYQPVIPQVTGISSPTGTQGSAAGGSAVTISGSGFLANVAGDQTIVNFVDTANTSITVPAPYVSVSTYTNGSQTITASTPPITTGTTYFVTVSTTPGGTSSMSAAYEWTFQPLYPVVAGVSPTLGGSGTQITITGIGFVSGQTTIQFVPTSGNGTTLTGTNVQVSSSTQLTANVPSGGTNNATYYVQVTTTSGGPSGTGGGTPVYTY
jgi:hypothetical protein